MPPTETEQGMLCLSRHDNCPWDQALKDADVTWTGLQYACLKVLHLYCKAFEKEDIIDLVIRKTCKSCGCDRLQHSVYHEELGSVRERLGLRETRAALAHDGPPGLTAKQTELYWSSLAEREPNVGGATGAAAWREWRMRALATQLPKQDLALSHTRHLEDEHRKQFEDFVAARNEIALDIGVAGQHHGAAIECLGCDKPIRNGGITVRAPRLGEEAFFHPACFSCSECDELLVELAYCALDGRLFCVRHYAERLKPRCHACDELFKSCPGVISLHPSCSRQLQRNPPRPVLTRPGFSTRVNMGLVLSAIISYAGTREALECLRHILAGVVPPGDPDFQDLVDHYSGLLKKAANPANHVDWASQCGQGYLCLSQDDNGKLNQAAVKYYDGQPNSTAILFSTKISSFGQESVESNGSQANGDCRTERYTPTRTKTIITNTSESFSVGNRNRSPTSCEHVSDPNLFSENSSDRDERDAREISEAKEKLTWHYRPKSPTPQNLPEIHFQSTEDDTRGDEAYSEDFLRSLDGIKFRPLQRSDPSGRRRSFKKRHSSSSTSSRDSRASREEELKMFTSLEEAELERAQFGSAPNLAARSYSRSRSREHSKERRPDSAADPDLAEEEADKPKLKDLPKLGSFEEDEKEVNEEEEEIEDFWGNGD